VQTDRRGPRSEDNHPVSSTYRGHRIRRLEWGLWKDLDRPGWYLLQYRPAGRYGPQVRRWAYADGVRLTLQDLQAHVRQARAAALARAGGIAPAASAQDVLDLYIADLERASRHPRHVSDVRGACERFLAFAGARTLHQITPHQVEAWLMALHEAPRSPRTLNKLRGHLRAWLQWAVERQYLAQNPVAAVRTARQATRLPRFLLPDDFRSLIDASPPVHAALWTFLVRTGLRLGSWFSLTPECFHDGGFVVPHTKRGIEWWIGYDDGCPLWSADLRDLALEAIRGGLLSPGKLRRALKEDTRSANLDFTSHGFRHTYCSWLVMMGEQLSDVQAWAHHASVTTTERYAHLRPHGRARLEEHRTAVMTVCEHGARKALSARPKSL